MLDASKMVSNENPRGLTIHTNKIRTPFFILGRHPREGETDRKTLTRTSSSLSRIRACRGLDLLRLDASRALVNNRMLVLISKLGNTIDVLVGIIQIIITWMS